MEKKNELIRNDILLNGEIFFKNDNAEDDFCIAIGSDTIKNTGIFPKGNHTSFGIRNVDLNGVYDILASFKDVPFVTRLYSDYNLVIINNPSNIDYSKIYIDLTIFNTSSNIYSTLSLIYVAPIKNVCYDVLYNFANTVDCILSYTTVKDLVDMSGYGYTLVSSTGNINPTDNIVKVNSISIDSNFNYYKEDDKKDSSDNSIEEDSTTPAPEDNVDNTTEETTSNNEAAESNITDTAEVEKEVETDDNTSDEETSNDEAESDTESTDEVEEAPVPKDNKNDTDDTYENIKNFYCCSCEYKKSESISLDTIIEKYIEFCKKNSINRVGKNKFLEIFKKLAKPATFTKIYDKRLNKIVWGFKNLTLTNNDIVVVNEEPATTKEKTTTKTKKNINTVVKETTNLIKLPDFGKLSNIIKTTGGARDLSCYKNNGSIDYIYCNKKISKLDLPKIYTDQISICTMINEVIAKTSNYRFTPPTSGKETVGERVSTCKLTSVKPFQSLFSSNSDKTNFIKLTHNRFIINAISKADKSYKSKITFQYYNLVKSAWNNFDMEITNSVTSVEIRDIIASLLTTTKNVNKYTTLHSIKNLLSILNNNIDELFKVPKRDEPIYIPHIYIDTDILKITKPNNKSETRKNMSLEDSIKSSLMLVDYNDYKDKILNNTFLSERIKNKIDPYINTFKRITNTSVSTGGNKTKTREVIRKCDSANYFCTKVVDAWNVKRYFKDEIQLINYTNITSEDLDIMLDYSSDIKRFSITIDYYNLDKEKFESYTLNADPDQVMKFDDIYKIRFIISNILNPFNNRLNRICNIESTLTQYVDKECVDIAESKDVIVVTNLRMEIPAKILVNSGNKKYIDPEEISDEEIISSTLLNKFTTCE